MMALNTEDIEKIFVEYDLNQNGFIDYDELKVLLVDLGVEFENEE
jgi:Ca2+-binding EF-hand superfamily protein